MDQSNRRRKPWTLVSLPVQAHNPSCRPQDSARDSHNPHQSTLAPMIRISAALYSPKIAPCPQSPVLNTSSAEVIWLNGQGW